jgi:uncharacterized alkaline shock family protein YloU
MSDTTATTPATAPTRTTGTTGTATPATGSALDTGQGRTVIADTVVLKIAGIATREVSGVAAVGAIRERIAGVGVDTTQGVTAEVGEKQAAIDIDIVAEYGVAISDLAGAIRSNVVSAVERMTGLEVTEVNITVHDVALDDDVDETTERVQ